MTAFFCFLFLVFQQYPQQERDVVSAGDLLKMASSSLVIIEAYGDDGRASSIGSGFIVSPDGAILTNYHVVAHSKRATVRLANGDAYDDVSVLDLDKRRDIALIKIKAVYLRPLKLGRSASVQVGDRLYAPENPPGALQNSLSEGILNGIRQGDGYQVFQLSTPISRGTSGSPVFDSHGDVVGIADVATDYGQSIGLAIPIDYAAALVSSRSPRPLESIYEPTKPGDWIMGNPSGLAPTARPSDSLIADAFTYLAPKISLWTRADAEKELGHPSVRREGVYEYNSTEGQYSTIELHFDQSKGKLAAIYFYPQGGLTWPVARGRLGNNPYVKKKAENGAVSYTYQNSQRTITVLVDSLGNVVSTSIW